jgi:hypothetical protein
MHRSQLITTVFILSFAREMASTGHEDKQGASAHCLQVNGILEGKGYFPSMKLMTVIRDLFAFISFSFAKEHANSQLLQPIHFSKKIFNCFGILSLPTSEA